MKIALIPNLTRKNAPSVAQSVCKELDRLNAEYFISDEYKNEFPFVKAQFTQKEKMIEDCDVIIAVGGDGTFIRAAKYGKPVLGINAGRLAFMAGLEEHEMHLLKNLIDENYEIDSRMMLRVDLYRDEALIDTNYCINDAVIARGTALKMCDMTVVCDDKKVNDYYADGIIVSTPTGSTAYALSAGGPVIDPSIESISITPICTHSLFSRSMIFKQNSVIKISVKNLQGGESLLSCDGGEAITLKENNEVIIKKAEFTAKFIRIKTDTFIDVLSQKLAQRRA